MARPRSSPRGRGSLAALLLVLLLVAVAVLAAALVYVSRTHSQGSAAAQATTASLRSQVAALQRQVATQQTAIAVQQRRIDQLQRLAAATQTPTNQANGPHSYIVLFQEDTYSCVFYLEWNEGSGILRDGRLLTADTVGGHSSKSFIFTGVDNAGRLSFAARGQGQTFTFSGARDAGGKIGVDGVPWSVFNGFTGGTFRQTLHPATRQQYTDAVANLP